ncbi:MAG: cbb3-type cytochrome c oxidase subunit I, partial [Bradyrhizobium sp.]|nr:cbb3-type cytochrome c oxidase subunit I [Bradyrhizobium sp.]
MSGYYKTLQTQRFDDYRYYHQSRINQTLHLISAVIFLVCYALLFKDPAMAGLVGWLAMLTRQTGHFFFEPNGYDHVNDVTNDYKEAVKVGYNQTRKIVLLTVWGLVPVALFLFPTLFGLFAGIAYWFPKAFGFKLDVFWGKMSFWFWTVGFYFAFMPLYVLGLMGVTRRLRTFDDPSLQIWFVIAGIGAFLILLGIASFLIQIAVSILRREQLADVSGAPWDARTLEWPTSS